MFFVLETVWQERQKRGNERQEETRDKNKEKEQRCQYSQWKQGKNKRKLTETEQKVIAWGFSMSVI